MKFIIKRTSIYGPDSAPCEGATLQPFPRWETRTINESGFNEKYGEREGLWRSKGTEHTTTEQGYITRKREDEMLWAIEINTIEELIAFHEKYGRLVIEESWNNDKFLQLEIYDDYRE